MTRTLGPASCVLDAAERHNLVGRVISNYRLLSVLGSGGAGTVYLAERADHQFSAKAAVKVIDRTATLDLGLRFRVERQILASLNHPNIARLLDAGETEDGQPYLIMEYVEGQTLERYCDERNLDLQARLELFIQICAAVQYAHQNLIIHRDIKPANILVTKDGAPKLLDFGIAKLMHARDLGRTAELTRMNDRVLTPEYASPEQITGGPVNTASDIYSLGVVLYRLLSGLRPYDLPNSANQLEMQRAICIIDPPRPSAAVNRALQQSQQEIAQLAAQRATTPERLKRQLVGDLDAIVMRAMRKEPEHRYSSVERLIADVRSYLNNEPVQARQGNWFYYAQRFVRRHTVGVAASAGFLVFLVAVAIVMSIQRQNIAAALAQAMQDRERAENVSEFMMNVFSAADPFINFGREPTARVLLDQAARNIQNDLTQQPEVRARLLETIGRSYRRIGELDRAITHLRDALLLSQKGSSDDSSPSSIVIELAIALRQAGRIDESEKYYTQAQEALRRANNQRSEAHANVLMDLSHLETMRGHIQRALDYANQALALMRALKGPNHREVGGILSDMSNIMLWADDLEGAERAAREAVRLYETAPEYHPERVMANYQLGEILFHRGRVDEAGALLERALAAQRRLYGSTTSLVADTLGTLAQVRLAQGNLQEAERLIRDALAAHLDSDSVAFLKIGYFQTLLATVWLRAHKFADAEDILRKTLTLFEAHIPPDHQYVASTEYYLGEALLAQGKLDQAEKVLTASMDRWRRSGASAWRSARSANALGETLYRLQRLEEAERLLVDSYRVLVADPAADQEAKQIAHIRIRRFYEELGQSKKLDALRHENVQQTIGPTSPVQPTSLTASERVQAEG